MAERTVKLVFLGGPSDSYARNLLINELVFAVVLVIGLVLQFYFRIEWGSIFIFFGIAVILIAPIYCLFSPSPKFLAKSQAELKGTLSPDEQFIGAVFGASFPGRPKIAVESTDNSFFVTNKHLFMITVAGLIVGGGIEQTPPYKTAMYDYLKKKGDELLKKSPREVLFSHNFNFSIPFDQVTKITLTSNFVYMLLGGNFVTVKATDATYRFLIHYPDEFDKFQVLLKRVIPEKVVRTALIPN